MYFLSFLPRLCTNWEIKEVSTFVTYNAWAGDCSLIYEAELDWYADLGRRIPPKSLLVEIYGTEEHERAEENLTWLQTGLLWKKSRADMSNLSIPLKSTDEVKHPTFPEAECIKEHKLAFEFCWNFLVFSFLLLYTSNLIFSFLLILLRYSVLLLNS